MGEVVVIDTGSALTKAGWAGNDEPSQVISSIVGHPRTAPSILIPFGTKQYYIGDEALSKKGIMTIVRPFKDGGVVEESLREKAEAFWDGVLHNYLRLYSPIPPLLLTEPAWNPAGHREKILNYFMETHLPPSMCLIPSATLSMLATGKQTGVVVDLGDSCCSAVPIYQGSALKSAAQRNNVGGAAITNLLMQLLTNRGYSFTTTAEREIVRDIKEKLGYIAENFDEELKLAASSSRLSKSYELPDGQVIDIQDERFRAPEAIFNPCIIAAHETEASLTQLVVNAVAQSANSTVFKNWIRVPKCSHLAELPQEIHERVCRFSATSEANKMYDHVVLAGGGAKFLRLDTRLTSELHENAPGRVRNIEVVAPENMKYSSWIGGSELASLSTFPNFCVTKEEFDEVGPHIINTKFP